MAKLTQEQIDFLEAVGVSLDQTFNATGLPKRIYSEIMKRDDLTVAYGVTACLNGGHKLRTRSGHCIQCNTANLRFQERHNESGFLYLAECEDAEILKIGVAQNIVSRQSSLRQQGYGGFTEWKIVFSQWIENSGEVEKSIHREIARFRIMAEYHKEGRMQFAYELFEISKKAALDVIRKNIY
jgi:hypothetical protein